MNSARAEIIPAKRRDPNSFTNERILLLKFAPFEGLDKRQRSHSVGCGFPPRQ